jgi:protein involved in polysaccharide export with SLBB domain
VRIMGAVRAPGRFEFSDEMSLLDVLAQAGGPSERADLSRLRIVASDSGPASTFDLQRFMERGGRASSLPRIRGNYTIMVPEQPNHPTDTRAQWLLQPPERSIYVMGSVGRPGRYAFDQSNTFLDIMAAADGPTASADITAIRVTHSNERRNRVSRVNLSQFLETGDRSLLPRVRTGDVIFVPDRNRNPLEQNPATVVRVLGAVNRPGRYPFNDGMTLLDLLAESGGPSRDALAERIVVVNLSCCADQARLFNLPRFARTGDTAMLPVIRAGDTIYVPDSRQSEWRQFFDGMRDVVTSVSLIALLRRL